MFLKLARAFWAISVLCVFSALLYAYASLPGEQVLIQETSQGNVYLTREVVFYIGLAFIMIINVLVFVINSIMQNNAAFRGWFYGLITTLNIFTIFALFTLNLINSAERYDFSRTGNFLYGSLGLIVVWCLTLPLWIVLQKKIAKD